MEPILTIFKYYFVVEQGSPCEKVGHLSLQENFNKESTAEELKHEVRNLIFLSSMYSVVFLVCNAVL